ncbi:hypothetical protein G9A89_001364 [Geosiphon pyriformis]|nr:hypothetical protein G9A89_001364 [Geosiphon pyriformis]
MPFVYSESQTSLESGFAYVDDQKLKYLRPKNFEDISTMNILHYLYQFSWGSLFSAPVDEILNSSRRHILDVGCSTGLWILDMAKSYPLARFVGCDMTPVFPTIQKDIPKNVKFVQVNILNGLPFPDQSFDYVRASLFVSTLTEDEWLFAIRELARVLSPGGWLELMEPDYRLCNMGPDTKKFVKGIMEIFRNRRINVEISQKLELILAATPNLSNTHHSIKHIEVGKSGGKVGVLFQDTLTIYFTKVYCEAISQVLGLTQEEYLVMWNNCEKEFPAYQTYCRAYRFWSQKE